MLTLWTASASSLSSRTPASTREGLSWGAVGSAAGWGALGWLAGWLGWAGLGTATRRMHGSTKCLVAAPISRPLPPAPLHHLLPC